jgi:hypothetical protein
MSPLATDPTFTEVFAGPLFLEDGRLAIGDIECLTRFVLRVGDRGARNVRVAVDSPGWNARAIDITVGSPGRSPQRSDVRCRRCSL